MSSHAYKCAGCGDPVDSWDGARECAHCKDWFCLTCMSNHWHDLDDARDEVMTTQHLYQPMLRPASFATLPTGLTWEYKEAPTYLPKAPAPPSRHKHGVIKTDRQLTTNECERFALRPINPNGEPS